MHTNRHNCWESCSVKYLLENRTVGSKSGGVNWSRTLHRISGTYPVKNVFYGNIRRWYEKVVHAAWQGCSVGAQFTASARQDGHKRAKILESLRVEWLVLIGELPLEAEMSWEPSPTGLDSNPTKSNLASWRAKNIDSLQSGFLLLKPAWRYEMIGRILFWVVY